MIISKSGNSYSKYKTAQLKEEELVLLQTELNRLSLTD